MKQPHRLKGAESNRDRNQLGLLQGSRFFVAEVALQRVKSEGGRWEVMPPTSLLEGGDERK